MEGGREGGREGGGGREGRRKGGGRKEEGGEGESDRVKNVGNGRTGFHLQFDRLPSQSLQPHKNVISRVDRVVGFGDVDVMRKSKNEQTSSIARLQRTSSSL